MIAPCGIEIKVGQVWHGWADDGWMDFTVTGFWGDQVMRRWKDGVEDEAPPMSFTNNKRGGYRLVKDVEQRRQP